WGHMAGPGRAPSVFLAGLTEPAAAWRDDDLAARFERLLAVRGAVTKAIEEARQAGVVRQSSEARVVLGVEPGDLLDLLSRRAVPRAVCRPGAVPGGDAGRGRGSPVLAGLRVAVERAPGKKCPRCWNVRVLGEDARHPDLCARCAAVIG